ncbi:MAG: right-handed parallel beta-helix repeat-containing protein [Candidatus Thorarchaeota archaeon]
MPDRVSSCFLLLTLFMLALTPVADLEGMAAQSTMLVSEPERRGMLLAGTPHGPIAIDGDASFSDTALLEGWPGDGSPENPYIIDGLDIDLGGEDGHCISISNTRVNFTISNCNLAGAFVGIGLENVTYGELVENIVDGNYYGAQLRASSSNTVENNTCSSNSIGISLEESYSNTVANNTCTSNDNGITLDGSDSNTVVNNICNTTNTVVNNICNTNDHGIYLWVSNHNTVIDNTCNSNRAYGRGWTNSGIYVSYSTSNIVSDNTCSNNDYGIFFYDSDSNIVANNTCNNNRIGIYLYDSDSNTVANNTCNSNEYAGIKLGYDAGFNTVSDNTCSNTDSGIFLDSSNSNTVSDNTCNNNRIGIYLYESDSNTVVNNTCFDNTEHDIYLYESDIITEMTGEFETEEFDPAVLLLIGLLGITLLGAGWWKVYARGGQDDIIVPTRYRLASWFREIRNIPPFKNATDRQDALDKAVEMIEARKTSWKSKTPTDEEIDFMKNLRVQGKSYGEIGEKVFDKYGYSLDTSDVQRLILGRKKGKKGNRGV